MTLSNVTPPTSLSHQTSSIITLTHTCLSVLGRLNDCELTFIIMSGQIAHCEIESTQLARRTTNININAFLFIKINFSLLVDAILNFNSGFRPIRESCALRPTLMLRLRRIDASGGKNKNIHICAMNIQAFRDNVFERGVLFLLLLLSREKCFAAAVICESFANIYISAYTYMLHDRLLNIRLALRSLVVDEAGRVGQDFVLRCPLTKYEITLGFRRGRKK